MVEVKNRDINTTTLFIEARLAIGDMRLDQVKTLMDYCSDNNNDCFRCDEIKVCNSLFDRCVDASDINGVIKMRIRGFRE